MSAKGSITDYFKPKANASHTPSPSPRRGESSSSRRSSSPLPLIGLSSPVGGSSSTSPLPPDRKATILDSDDDDGNDSDDSLPDLSAAVRVPAGGRGAEVTTPRAKRTALEFYSSPLTIMPKRKLHRFDMNALLSHVQRDEAANASAMRVAVMLDEEKERERQRARGTVGGASGVTTKAETGKEMRKPAALFDTIMDVLPGGGGEDGEFDHERVMRAVKRTEAAATRKRWYFFGPDAPSQPLQRTPFPVAAATGPWRFLSRPENRQADVARGLASTVWHRGHELPDEIFLWLLDEIGVERDVHLSREYHCLLGPRFDAERNEHVHHDQVHSLIDEERIQRLFHLAGASPDGVNLSAKMQGVADGDAPYTNRKDWHPLRAVLRLLMSSACSLSLKSLICATSILLRMSVDSLIHRNVDLFAESSKAMENLLEAVPPRDWNGFCDEIVTSMNHSISEATLWWDAVSSLPSGEARFQDFRRRLAMVFFFGDVQRAHQHPEETFSIRAVIDRLGDGEFIVDRETDYYEFAAYIYLLNVVVDDGSPSALESQSAEQQFNADVDELTRAIKNLEQKIPQSAGGYSSRLEAKAILGAVRSRLPYAVRTRPPRKNDIYDRVKGKEDDPCKPRQQMFMQNFLKRERTDSTKVLDHQVSAA